MGTRADQVAAVAAPLAGEADLELVEVEVKGQGGRQLVRVTVDRKGGVAIEQCQALSRELSARLDEIDPIPGRFTLEVTSPGIDRPLTDREEFDRIAGIEVVVDRAAADGASMAPLRGTVIAAEEDVVVLDVDGRRMPVAYDQIAKATQVLPW